MTKKIIMFLIGISFFVASLTSCGDNTFKINIDQGIINGTVTTDTSRARKGDTINVTATADQGFTLKAITFIANSESNIIINNNFEMPASDVLISATFIEVVETVDTFTITIENVNGGTINTNLSSAIAGTTINVTAIANTGYEISRVFFTVGDTSTTINDGVFVMPAANVVVSADFTLVEIDSSRFKNPFGFASEFITTRCGSTITYVSTALEFIDAIASQRRVIQISDGADISLGYHNITRDLEAAGRNTLPTSLFREATSQQTGIFGGRERLHPDLAVSGVGRLIIDNAHDMMVFSQNGATIRHVRIDINNSTNLIFRNFEMRDLWEWDDRTQGSFDNADWQHFQIRYSSDLWFDHMTFGIAYDGIIDIEDRSTRITISYIEVEGHITDFVRRQFDYLREHKEDFPHFSFVYSHFQEGNIWGLDWEDLLTIHSGQRKGFNIGTATNMTGMDFDLMTITIHNSVFTNFMDRLPRLRGGDVHLYNIITDQTDLWDLRNRIDAVGAPEGQDPFRITTQAIVTTQEGAVLADSMLFINVRCVVRTNQQNVVTPDKEWSGSFLIRNSENRRDGVSCFIDSDQEGTSFVSTSRYDENREFYWNNFQVPPYIYTTVPTNQLHNHLNGRVGSGVAYGVNWLYIDVDAGMNDDAVHHQIDEAALRYAMPERLFFIIGEELTFPRPRVLNFYTLRTHTEFVEGVDYTIDIIHDIEPMTEGEFLVIMRFISLINPNDIVEIEIIAVILPEENSFVESPVISDEFNGYVDIDFITVHEDGRIFYYASNDPSLAEAFVKEQNQYREFTGREFTFEDIRSNHNNYLFFVLTSLYDNEIYDFVKVSIPGEVVVSISTAGEFIEMLGRSVNQTVGYYFILMNDIDFTDETIVRSENFQGVFNGGGFTLYNITFNQALFFITRDAVIRNFTINNASITGNIQHGAAIIIGRTQGHNLVEDIVIINSNIGTEEQRAIHANSAFVVGNLDNNNSLILRNIALVDSSIWTTGNYTAALVGHGFTNINHDFIIEDIYISGVVINSTGRGIGLLVARVRTPGLMISRVVITDSYVRGNFDVGVISGIMGQNMQEGYATLQDIFINNIDLSIISATHNSIGYITGETHANAFDNPGFIRFNNAFAVSTFDTELSGDTSINITNVLDSITTVDLNWWTDNLNSFVDSTLWTFCTETNIMGLR